jgi:hypothetical protein
MYRHGIYKFTMEQINSTTNVLQSPVAALRANKFKDENFLHSAHTVSFYAIISPGFYNRERISLLRVQNEV